MSVVSARVMKLENHFVETTADTLNAKGTKGNFGYEFLNLDTILMKVKEHIQEEEHFVVVRKRVMGKMFPDQRQSSHVLVLLSSIVRYHHRILPETEMKGSEANNLEL